MHSQGLYQWHPPILWSPGYCPLQSNGWMHSLQMNCFDVLLWIGIPIFIKPHNLPHAYRVKPQIFSLTLLWSNMFLPTTPLQGFCNSSQTPFCNTYTRISVSCCWLISFSLWNYFNLVPYVQILTTPQGSAPLPFPSWIPSWFFSYNSNFPLLGNGGTFYLYFSNSTYHCFLILQIILCPSLFLSFLKTQKCIPLHLL